MAGDKESDTFDTGGVFTFGQSRFAENVPSQFYIRNDPIVELACGDEHTVCICQKGRVFVFGSNDYGQLGLGHKNVATKPTCVKTLKPQRSVHAACGRAHTVVSTGDGRLYACGCNSDGQLGLGDTTDRYLPTQIPDFEENVVQLSAGSHFTVALTESGQLYVWGNNGDGELGLPNSDSELVLSPTPLPFDQPIVYVSCGYYHMAFITEDGSLYVCGEGDSGKLGLSDSTTGVNEPHRVSLGSRVSQVSCGGSHTVAVTAEGKVYAFGSNFSGQLGLGVDVTQSVLPSPVVTLDRWKIGYVSCGESHTAFITRKGHLFTCGDGKHDKLCMEGGNNTSTKQFLPTQITRFNGFRVEKVTCGGCHTMVLANRRDDTEDDSQSNDSDSGESLASIAHRSLPPLQKIPLVGNLNNNVDSEQNNELSTLEDEIVNNSELTLVDELNNLADEFEKSLLAREVDGEGAAESSAGSDAGGANSESDDDILRQSEEKTAEMKSDAEEEDEGEGEGGSKKGDEDSEDVKIETEGEEEGDKPESRVTRFFNTFRRRKTMSAQSVAKLDTTDISQRAVSEGVRRRERGSGDQRDGGIDKTTGLGTNKKSKTCVII